MHQSWTCLSLSLSLSLSLDFSPSNFPTTFICRHRGSGCGCRRNKSQNSAFPFSNGFHVRPRIWGRRKVGKGKIKPLFLFKVFGNLCDHYHRTNSGDSSDSPGKSCGGNAYWANGS